MAADSAGPDDAAARWDALAGDLLGAAQAAEAAERRAMAGEVSRAEVAGLRLVDRLRGAVGQHARVEVRGSVEPVRGVLVEAGDGWLLVADQRGETLVPLVALLSISGIDARSAPPAPDRLGARASSLGRRLRSMSRDRVAVRVVLRSGAAFRGTIDAVGADHLEVTERSPDDVRRTRAAERVVVPFAAIGVVRVLPPAAEA